MSSQLHYIRKVIINAEALEVVGSFLGREYEILPILRLIWCSNAPDVDISISDFMRSGYARSYSVPALNSILESVGRQDSLRLRRYARFPKAIDSITVKENVWTGTITYGSIYGIAPRTRNAFVTSDGGSRATLDPPARRFEASCGFSALPDRAYRSILEYATHIPGGVHVDLGSKPIRAASLGILRVSRQLRSDAMQLLLRNCHFILTFTSSHTRIRLPNYRTINEWVLLDDFDIECCLDSGHHMGTTMGSAQEVKFMFDCRRGEIDPDDVRINITEFLCETMQVRGSAAIYGRRSASENGSTPLSQTIFSLDALRLNVFIILSHVLESKPWRRNRICPAVYINGHGFAVETINPRGKRCQFLPRAAKLVGQQKNALEEGMKYAHRFGHLAPRPVLVDQTLSPNPSMTTKSTLVEVWGHLRDSCLSGLE